MVDVRLACWFCLNLFLAWIYKKRQRKIHSPEEQDPKLWVRIVLYHIVTRLGSASFQHNSFLVLALLLIHFTSINYLYPHYWAQSDHIISYHITIVSIISAKGHSSIKQKYKIKNQASRIRKIRSKIRYPAAYLSCHIVGASIIFLGRVIRPQSSTELSNRRTYCSTRQASPQLRTHFRFSPIFAERKQGCWEGHHHCGQGPQYQPRERRNLLFDQGVSWTREASFCRALELGWLLILMVQNTLHIFTPFTL